VFVVLKNIKKYVKKIRIFKNFFLKNPSSLPPLFGTQFPDIVLAQGESSNFPPCPARRGGKNSGCHPEPVLKFPTRN
jgi:hypothetical protein